MINPWSNIVARGHHVTVKNIQRPPQRPCQLSRVALETGQEEHGFGAHSLTRRQQKIRNDSTPRNQNRRLRKLQFLTKARPPGQMS